MKKLLSLFLGCFMVFSLAACSSSSPATPKEETTETNNTASSDTSKEDAAATQNTSESEEMKGSVEGGQQYQCIIDVDQYGPITLILDEGIAPKTVENFVKLANEGFYNGLKFHRIMDGFMIQGGAYNPDINSHQPDNIEGEFLLNGFNNTLSHKKGVISMARASNPNSASSQFFICDEDSTFLDGQYAAFGWVTDGMDVVQEIADKSQPIDDNGTIPEDQQPVINTITVTELGS